MSKTPHPYADILRAIADGETVQWLSAGNWTDQEPLLTLREIGCVAFPPSRYRIKPSTIRVGEMEVPEPMRKTPDVGAPYWVINLTTPTWPGSSRWADDSADERWLARGLCYSNPTDAVIAGRAIVALFAPEGAKP